jgi:hypothetical protein
MPVLDEESHETDLPTLAVQGLKQAHDRTVLQRLPFLFVRDGQLLGKSGGTITVLKQVPPRKKVNARREPALP